MKNDFWEELPDMAWDNPAFAQAQPVRNPDVWQLEIERSEIERKTRGHNGVYDHLTWHEGHRVRVQFNITDGKIDGVNEVRAVTDRKKWTVENWTPGIVDLI